MRSVKPLFPTLLANYRVLVYSGQLDAIIGAALTDAFLQSLQWPGAAGYLAAARRVWRSDVRVGSTDVVGRCKLTLA